MNACNDCGRNTTETHQDGQGVEPYPVRPQILTQAGVQTYSSCFMLIQRANLQSARGVDSAHAGAVLHLDLYDTTAELQSQDHDSAQ